MPFFSSISTNAESIVSKTSSSSAKSFVLSLLDCFGIIVFLSLLSTQVKSIPETKFYVLGSRNSTSRIRKVFEEVIDRSDSMKSWAFDLSFCSLFCSSRYLEPVRLVPSSKGP